MIMQREREEKIETLYGVVNELDESKKLFFQKKIIYYNLGNYRTNNIVATVRASPNDHGATTQLRLFRLDLQGSRVYKMAGNV